MHLPGEGMATKVTQYSYPTLWKFLKFVLLRDKVPSLVFFLFCLPLLVSEWLMSVRSALFSLWTVWHWRSFLVRRRSCAGRQWAPRHCNLSAPAAAADWCWAASRSCWTSLTAKMRESMLCRVVPSNGWEVYQWELLKSDNRTIFLLRVLTQRNTSDDPQMAQELISEPP